LKKIGNEAILKRINYFQKKYNMKEKIAEMLLNIEAVKLSPSKPFTWASGWKSPIYCDNRKALSYPEVRDYVRDAYVRVIKKEFPDTEVIAGVATGAIAQAALVAQALNLPMVYVRSAAKAHGMTNLVEGVVKAGQKVVVIEDLISTGGSSLKAVQALREMGCEVLGLVAIFSYNFDVASQSFEQEKCKLLTLSDYQTLNQIGLQKGFITENDLDNLKKWRENPNTWGQNL